MKGNMAVMKFSGYLKLDFIFFLIRKSVTQVNMTELSNFNLGSHPKQDKTVFKNLCDS